MKKQYTLEGLDGNAFNIIAHVQGFLKQECKPKDFKKDGFCKLAVEYTYKAVKAKDYQELLSISQDYIDLANGVKK